MLFALLTGCGSSAPPAGETVRAYYDGLQSAQTHAKILSDFGDSALEYEVDYEYNKEDNDLLTITAPESIAGVQVEISGEHADAFTLRYAEAELMFGGGNIPGLTPADAIADLLYDLRTGEPTEASTEPVEDITAVRLHYETADQSPAIAKTVWIDPDTMAPVCAELYCDGDKQLTLYFEQFQ